MRNGLGHFPIVFSHGQWRRLATPEIESETSRQDCRRSIEECRAVRAVLTVEAIGANKGESNPDGFSRKTSGQSDECRWGHVGFWGKTRFDLRGTGPVLCSGKNMSPLGHHSSHDSDVGTKIRGPAPWWSNPTATRWPPEAYPGGETRHGPYSHR